MAEPMTDRGLLREYVKRGSETAFRSLVERHVDLVFATANRQLNDATAAQEVTQNVFIALARKAITLQGDNTLTGWLHKTTLLESRQWWRGEYRRQRREQTAIELGTTMKDEESLLQSMTSVLDEGLMELREPERQALMLRYFEEQSHQQIGKALGTGEDAARKRIEKSLEKLTQFFRRRGYAVPAVATTAAALKAAAQTAPTGLSNIVTKGAMAAGSAGSVTGLGLLIGTIMGLTKTQTVVICAALAAIPVAYQTHSLIQARVERTKLEARLIQTSQDLQQVEKSREVAEKKFASTRNTLRTLQEQAEQQRAQAAKIRTNLYAWSDKSEYVRIPKSLVGKLILSESQYDQFRGRESRGQMPVLSKDGSFSPVLAEVLDMTSAEFAQVQLQFQGALGQFLQIAEQHRYETNVASTSFSSGLPHTRTFVTTAFPQEGEELRDQLRNNWVQALGQERAEIVWGQTSEALEDGSNGYGAKEKIETVSWSDERIAYGTADREPGTKQENNAHIRSADWAFAEDIIPQYLKGYLPAPPAKKKSKRN
jgi:RNA polymerase sigma factor (sigma-70 family)